MHLKYTYNPTPPDTNRQRYLRGKCRVSGIVRIWCLFIFVGGLAGNVVAQDITFPMPPGEAPIQVRAEEGYQWQTGEYQIWHLNNVQLRQHEMLATAPHAVIWIDKSAQSSDLPTKVIAYFEGLPTRILEQSLYQSSMDSKVRFEGTWWINRFYSVQPLQLVVDTQLPTPRSPSDTYNRGVLARKGGRPVVPTGVSGVAYQPPPADIGGLPPSDAAARNTTLALGDHRVLIEGRSNVDWSLKIEQDPSGNGSIALAKSGIRATIEGINVAELGPVGNISIETDNMVVWGPSINQLQDDDNTGKPQPIELYLEGNIIFRQGDRIIYADRMYYDLTRDLAVVLNAEMLTPIPEYDGVLRVKADVIQQVNKQTYKAYGAALTSSRMGIPTYWFQAEEVEVQDTPRPDLDPVTGRPIIDPETGKPRYKHNLMATSRNNFLFVGGVPVFYWPVMATNLQSPTYYMDRIRVKSDSVYGGQLLLDWNAYQLLGLQDAPEGVKWTVSTDIMSKRGFGFGSMLEYERDDMFNIPGPARGLFDAWAINENGLDNLGAGRRTLAPEKDFRGRVYWQHRQLLGGGYQLTGELGIISDRHFLEQYYEHEWDQEKDQNTSLELKRFIENQSWSVWGNVRLNDFFTQTDWLPRFDHNLIGESLWSDRITWHEHTHIGLARLKQATPPDDPGEAAKFDWLAGEEHDRSGVRAASRHEFSMPLSAGPVKVVPYVLGEVGYWANDINSNSVERAYGQVGVRANLPMWRVDHDIKSVLFNVNGLAHKVNWFADFYWADSNQDMDVLPRYDALDDDATEHFRRRHFFDTFGGTAGDNVHAKWDERYYALRRNMQGWVTAPVTEIAADMSAIRLGVQQRWQTKRGLPGRERIVDWMELDTELTLFPNAERDNFGQEVGLIDYDYRWHVGDRVTLMSDGFTDLFGDGFRMFTVGGQISRPDSGRLYLGYRSMDGPIDGDIIHGSLSYRMSEKWIAIAGTTFDLSETGNIGQSLSVVRIGESTLVRVGVHYDESRDNFGVHLSIEPRFLSSSKIARRSGIHIPPAGAYGLE